MGVPTYACHWSIRAFSFAAVSRSVMSLLPPLPDLSDLLSWDGRVSGRITGSLRDSRSSCKKSAMLRLRVQHHMHPDPRIRPVARRFSPDSSTFHSHGMGRNRL